MRGQTICVHEMGGTRIGKWVARASCSSDGDRRKVQRGSLADARKIEAFFLARDHDDAYADGAFRNRNSTYASTTQRTWPYICLICCAVHLFKMLSNRRRTALGSSSLFSK
jgi:hypothetical protein